MSEEQIREELDNLVKKLPIEKLETARRFDSGRICPWSASRYIKAERNQ
ncbi:MAG: hypothetical protein ACYCV0_11495 [Desulfitobacteriaceae bacterium]